MISACPVVVLVEVQALCHPHSVFSLLLSFCIFRMISSFIYYAYNFSMLSGTGGESIYGGKFAGNCEAKLATQFSVLCSVNAFVMRASFNIQFCFTFAYWFIVFCFLCEKWMLPLLCAGCCLSLVELENVWFQFWKLIHFSKTIFYSLLIKHFSLSTR